MADRKREVVVPLIVFLLAVGFLSRSPALSNIRSVDALLMFVAGAAAGVSAALLLKRF